MIWEKFTDNLKAVIPIIVIVSMLHFFLVPLGMNLFLRFLIGSLLVIVGLTIFLLGVEIGITPLGSLTGNMLAKSNKVGIVIVAGLIFGFFISIAEPGLMVLANQVNGVTGGSISGITILITVSIGLAVMLAVGFFRVFYNIPLYLILIVLYTIIFVMALFTSREFLAISFDASGSTTGILAVPFILALSLGISSMKKDSKASEKDSFGLVAIASTGAIISVMLLSMIKGPSKMEAPVVTAIVLNHSMFGPFQAVLKQCIQDGIVALFPLLLIFLSLNYGAFHLKKRAFHRIIMGFIYAFLGLVIFMIGVNGAFMEVGTTLGQSLALLEQKWVIVAVGFVLGVVTILAEPAVFVLTQQIEEVTSGYVSRKAVLLPLSLGVGIAVALAILRILTPDLQLWHYLLPGYLLCILLMFLAPKIFVGMAFDAGGVATGPMTATFILAFTQGAANAFEGADLLADGFGMIAMVAMTPIITLQILGVVFRWKASRKGDKKA